MKLMLHFSSKLCDSLQAQRKKTGTCCPVAVQGPIVRQRKACASLHTVFDGAKTALSSIRGYCMAPGKTPGKRNEGSLIFLLQNVQSFCLLAVYYQPFFLNYITIALKLHCSASKSA